jgi:hypothetical protein
MRVAFWRKMGALQMGEKWALVYYRLIPIRKTQSQLLTPVPVAAASPDHRCSSPPLPAPTPLGSVPPLRAEAIAESYRARPCAGSSLRPCPPPLPLSTTLATSPQRLQPDPAMPSCPRRVAPSSRTLE